MKGDRRKLLYNLKKLMLRYRIIGVCIFLVLMADIITRLIISIQKYIKAIASANLRTNALNSDVDYAFKLIRHKLDYLSSLGSSDTTNDYGNPVSADIYLYQKQTGDHISTKKMLLLKQILPFSKYQSPKIVG